MTDRGMRAMALSYPSDLSDEQWELLVAMLPCAKPGGRPRSVDVRAIVNAIFYIVVAGCNPWSAASYTRS